MVASILSGRAGRVGARRRAAIAARPAPRHRLRRRRASIVTWLLRLLLLGWVLLLRLLRRGVLLQGLLLRLAGGRGVGALRVSRSLLPLGGRVLSILLLGLLGLLVLLGLLLALLLLRLLLALPLLSLLPRRRGVGSRRGRLLRRRRERRSRLLLLLLALLRRLLGCPRWWRVVGAGRGCLLWLALLPCLLLGCPRRRRVVRARRACWHLATRTRRRWVVGLAWLRGVGLRGHRGSNCRGVLPGQWGRGWRRRRVVLPAGWWRRQGGVGLLEVVTDRINQVGRQPGRREREGRRGGRVEE